MCSANVKFLYVGVCLNLKLIIIIIIIITVEACPLRKSVSSSLDSVVNRFFMKLFKTNNIHVVNYCRMQFNFELYQVL